MTKFNKGDVVVVVVEDEDVAKGTVLTIESGPEGLLSGGNYFFKETSEIVLGDSLELISQKPTKKQRIKALEAEVAELKAKVEAYEKAQASPKTIPVTTDNIAVGDKIRMIDSSIICAGHDLTNGNVYEVFEVDSKGDIFVKDDASNVLVIMDSEFVGIEKVVSE